MRVMEVMGGGNVGGEAEMTRELLAASETSLLPMHWRPGVQFTERKGTLYLELCMRFSPAQPTAGPMFNASRAWQAALLWDDVVVLTNALGGVYPGLLAAAFAAGPAAVGGLPAQLIDRLAQMYGPNQHPALEVRVLEAVQQPGTGPMAARVFTDRRNAVMFVGAALCADAVNRFNAAPNSVTVHIWPDASRMVRSLASCTRAG